jgi:S-(hydroxymethyl)glutathione dehydrogenase/alcohol dehydrogenase
MQTRSAILYEFNQPLRIETVELPKLRLGQVLVKVAYSGVCHSQIMEARGKRGPDPYLPHLLGHEGSGIVIEVGEGVKKVKRGDSVVLTWIKGIGAECGGTQYRKGDLIINAGFVTTFSDYAVVSENRCVRITQDIPMDIAALLGCAVPTGAGVIINTLNPGPNSSVVIWGVGGIGLIAVMAAKLTRCDPIIAVDVHESKLEMAHTFGATHLVNARTEDAQARIHEIAGSDGVDYAVEAAGRADSIEQAFQVVRKKGGSCVFASHPPAGERICLDPHDLISGKQIRGSWGGESNPDIDIPRFAQLYLEGKLPLADLITHRYSLAQINEALHELEHGNVGRPLVVM